MVNIFGMTEKVGERGPPGPAGSSNLKELVKWFPELAIEQIRKNVNLATFLVETLPPDKDWDVELDHKRVTMWRSFNHSRDEKVILRATAKTGGSVFEKLLPPMDVHQRYGIKFEKIEKNMYYADNKLFLRNSGRTVVLTITFLVGALPPFDGVVKEFILNDYHPEEKTEEHFRGLSISSVANEEKKFDLYLHGARNINDVSTSTGDNATVAAAPVGKNRLKIGSALKTSWFYTVQVKWGAQIEEPDGSMRLLDSSYAIYDNDKCLVEKTFQSPLLGTQQTSAFSVGGKKAPEGGDSYFTGILSNMEMLHTDYETIPTELLRFIATKQRLINDDLLVEAPASKKQKKTCDFQY